MYIRVTHAQYDPPQVNEDDLQAAGDAVVEAIKSLPGFISHQGAVNRETGAIIAISTWQDEVSAMFSRETLGDVISRYTSAGARLDPPAIYEVTNTA